jgi:hypothetical protein
VELVRDGIPANKRMDDLMSSRANGFDHVEMVPLRDGVSQGEDAVEGSRPLYPKNMHSAMCSK